MHTATALIPSAEPLPDRVGMCAEPPGRQQGTPPPGGTRSARRCWTHPSDAPREEGSLGVLEHVVDRTGCRPPSLFFDAELASSVGRDFIRTGAALMVGRYLPGFDPAGLLHPVQGRIQGALFNAQVFGQALNVRRDGIAVQWTAPGQNGEYEER